MRVDLGATGCLLSCGRGGGHRHHRTERGGKEHAAQDPLQDHLPDLGQRQGQRAYRFPAGSRNRLPRRVDGPGERLSERLDPRHAEARGRPALRCYRRLLRRRAVHRYPDQALLVRDASAARVRGCRSPRSRRAHRRRGARSGRRGLSEEVHQGHGRIAKQRAYGALRLAQSGGRREPLFPRDLDRRREDPDGRRGQGGHRSLHGLSFAGEQASGCRAVRRRRIGWAAARSGTQGSST